MIISKPPECKVRGSEQVGKWLPHEAFEGRLPDHIICHAKWVFAQDSGVAFIMRAQVERYIPACEPAEYNSIAGNLWLASAEELYYYGILNQHPPPSLRSTDW